MLLIVNQPQEQVFADVEAQGVTAFIGPTSATGWTTVWPRDVEDPVSARQGVRYLAIDETADGLQLDVFLGTGEILRRVWSWAPKVAPTGQTELLAAGLAELFACPDRQRDLEELLRSESFEPEELVESIDSLLDLPELNEPTPKAAAVAHRGDRQIARFAASIAGPAFVCAGPDGWTVLLASGEDESRSIQLAAGVSAGARRRDPVFLLWRDGIASGWSLLSRGEPVADWSWNTRWRLMESDPVGAEAQTVRRLVKALGHPLDESLLRALLRSRSSDRDPLAEFCVLLGLPLDLLDPVDDPERFHERAGLEHVGETSARTAVLLAASGAFKDPDAPPGWRVLSTAYAIGTLAAAVVCLAMTALGIAVLVTDGAVVDQSGVTGDDWALLALFAVLSLVLAPTAVVRTRRVRRRRARHAEG